jgi:hypothetical protein
MSQRMMWLREPQPPAPRISHREHLLPEALEGNCFNNPQTKLILALFIKEKCIKKVFKAFLNL